jgi:hypothetical protein
MRSQAPGLGRYVHPAEDWRPCGIILGLSKVSVTLPEDCCWKSVTLAAVVLHS